jgi:hypothetical protein
MTPLSAQYVWLPTLEAYFVDKDTGLPLASGYILFYEDTQRSVGKPVFQLTGSPPDYYVIEYGFYNLTGAWQITLDADGTIDQPIYFYPYDSNGDVQNYFIQIYNSGGVLQRSLENIPNIPGGGTGGTTVTSNLVANPQFSINYPQNAEPANPALVAGTIPLGQAVTPIAPGGWTFEQSAGSTAINIITFTEPGYIPTTPPSNPKFILNYQSMSPDSADSVKDIRLKYYNVNKFASTTQMYTFGFFGTLNTGTSLTAQLYLIKYYGTGGSPTATSTTLLGTLPFTNSYMNINIPGFLFGANSGTTLGTNNDDYVQLAIRFPNSVFNLSVTDFVLVEGTVNSPILPDLPEYVYSTDSLAGYFPPQNPSLGSDLGLPVINGITGFIPDYSIVGSFRESLASSMYGYLPCTGPSYVANYAYAASSTDNIPYSRLGNLLWNPHYNCYLFGGGKPWVTAYIPITASFNFLTLTTNQNGSVTSSADGTPATGFTFSTQHGATFNTDGLYAGSNAFWLLTHNEGSLAAAAAGTSGFTVENYTQVPLAPADKTNALITTNAGNVVPQSSYWTFSTSTTNYYVWQNIDGGGTDPAPGGTGIEVQIKSTNSNIDVAIANAQAVNGDQFTFITTVAASAIPAGANFTFYAGSAGTTQFYVYYTKAGVGTPPTTDTTKLVTVALTGAETAAQVALLTQTAINQAYFAVPDLSGYSLRGYDAGGNIDADAFTRWNRNNINPTTNAVGSYEFDTFLQHYHDYETPPAGVVAAGAVFGVAAPENANTTVTGFGETRGKNFAVNIFIHY